VTATQPVINDKDWPKTLEYLSEYFMANLGEQGNPLSYAIHPQVDVPPEAGGPSTVYGMVDLDMIARGPHTGCAYQIETRKVWEIMRTACSDHVCYIYIKGTTRAKHGRDAYQCLFDHYLGPKNVNNMASAAESKLSSKVRMILKGVTMQQYDVAKAHILASPSLKTSFSRSVVLYKEFIKECKTYIPMNVSEVHTKARGKVGN
jgi:hypothetical protein